MKDLIVLNSRLVAHFLGAALSPSQRQYVEFLPVCVGKLKASVADIRRILFGVHARHENPLPVVYVNRDYLNHARLVCKDALGGHYDKLVELGVDVEMAGTLADLSSDQITRIATCWPGPIVEFNAALFSKGLQLHSSAARYHASAYLAVSH